MAEEQFEKFKVVGITGKDYRRLVQHKEKTGQNMSWVVTQGLDLFFKQQEKKKR